MRIANASAGPQSVRFRDGHEMHALMLFSGLDPKQGGVQVSALTVLPAFENGALRGIVYGSDPTDSLGRVSSAVIESSKARLIGRILTQNWKSDVVVIWHVGMLKLLPFLRGFRGKIILFLHGIELWRPLGWYTNRLLRRVDLFLSNSDYTWERFLEYSPFLRGRPHITVPLGVGEPLQEEISPPGEVPSAVILGRIERGEGYKGHQELISAWRGVLANVPNARLNIVGDGDLRPELERQVESTGLANHIHFHGRVSESVKAGLLADARCLAMPSRGEGFGLVYLEAMRIGRPCLVSDCDAGREVVNPPEAGLAVNVKDGAAVSAAVGRLLSDGAEWRNWSAAARTRYQTHFTAASFLDRIRNVL